MYKVQVERMSHMQELHLPACSPQVTTSMVTQTRGRVCLESKGLVNKSLCLSLVDLSYTRGRHSGHVSACILQLVE
ncbi:hypothetical protein E2C01_040292 [Portunus trituberculatus]|uniref:Uncharacterized protein n=1 Tax=Portunus trituberculatus TaxID=210409 RepID=A0A5B7FH51_PORTR|nr:hypothetical protein [Portunus trituberculatus]